MARDTQQHELGAAGEEAAARFLLQQGWRLEARNWRPKGAQHGLELDIVARHKGCLIFVEVKTRKAGRTLQDRTQGNEAASDGIPVYASFTLQKRNRLVKAARHYLSAHDLWSLACRFDFISVEQGPDGRFFLEHHPHVIELGNLVDRSHAPWQPW